MEGQAFRAVVLTDPCSPTTTHLLASALNSLADRDAAASASQESQDISDSAETLETLEILQVALSVEARAELDAAGARSGVNVLLSRVNGPALASPVF